jgi:hypothetical protein
MNTNKIKMDQNTTQRVSGLNKLAYRDGYLYGVEQEHQSQEDMRLTQSIRDNDNAASGLLLGITATALTGLLGGAIFLLTHQNQPSTVPVNTAPAPINSQS